MSLLDKFGDQTLKNALGNITVKDVMDQAAVLLGSIEGFLALQSKNWQDIVNRGITTLERESTNWRNAIRIQIGGK